MLELGIGITNLVRRTTAKAADLGDDELRAGARRLSGTVVAIRPRAVAVLGVSAYRTAFEAPLAAVGRQPGGIEDALLWLLPNPSGLNAHYQLPALVSLFSELRAELA